MADVLSGVGLVGSGAQKTAHPESVSMALSERLANFLALRLNRAVPFRLGHWLQVIDDETLAELHRAVGGFNDGDISSAVDDLLTLVIIALSAETRRPDHEVDEVRLVQWVETLGTALSIESFRRCGWLLVEKPLSIRPEERIALKISAEGVRQSGGELMP